MPDLRTATLSDFTPCIGEEFLITGQGSALPSQLASARPARGVRAGASREAFALEFRAAPELRLSQGRYRVEHARLGVMELFLVQVGADASGSFFEAIFN